MSSTENGCASAESSPSEFTFTTNVAVQLSPGASTLLLRFGVSTTNSSETSVILNLQFERFAFTVPLFVIVSEYSAQASLILKFTLT